MKASVDKISQLLGESRVNIFNNTLIGLPATKHPIMQSRYQASRDTLQIPHCASHDCCAHVLDKKRVSIAWSPRQCC